MLRVTRYDDVFRLDMSCRQSRLLGYGASAYVVRGVLVDCGFPRAAPEVARFMEPQRLRGVMITHHHEDHAGNVAMVASRGVPIAMAPETRRMVEAPPPLEPYQRWIWGSPEPLELPVTPFAPDDLQLIPTPGHSSDHHVVWDPGQRTVFGGDLFLGVKVRVARRDENLRQLAESLHRVLALGPRRLFDGHRGLVTDAAGALAAKVQWMEDTIGTIEGRHRAGVSESEVLRLVFGREALSGYITLGDYSRRNFVRSVIATMA
jgi:glyoxylase-like metal-dependent hydrolase (beta-lactamase superfamily II)